MNKKIGNALVVGAGISGIRTSLDLAETGYGVTLIDRSPHLGGILSQLDYQFPTDRCGMCKMLPLVDRDASSQYCLRKGLFHENIQILLSTEIIDIEGEPGNFQVMLRQKPNWIDPELCVGCGLCVDACPVEVLDSFNEGFASGKAVYLPVPHTFPNTYIIDTGACNLCGECEKVCPTSAIKISEQERKKFRILVVDDELIVRDSLKDLLEEEGFSVDTAESGHAALDLLAERAYHLMLNDIKMPGMDGVELLKKTKEDFPDLTVVMMTAYATVETAVEAMKIGALDYLIKPFEPDNLIPMIDKIYEDLETAKGVQVEVGSVVLCGGTEYFDPGVGKNPYGYGRYSNVVTSLEFERIYSGSGPSGGKLIRPSDGKPIRKVGWIQCVGSRDLQSDADFCSNICCMYAIKEAVVAKKHSGDSIETTIFHMDMRTFGKSYQRYRDEAEAIHGVNFVRGRVHSIVQDEKSGDLLIRYTDQSGSIQEVARDMVVLSVGQRPVSGSMPLADKLGIELNQWGFFQTLPFSQTKTSRDGIMVGGSFSGLKDIADSVTQASAAALSASRVIHVSGGNLALETPSDIEFRDVSREPPRVLVAVCTCGDALSKALDPQEIASHLKTDPIIAGIEFLERTCTSDGWEALIGLVKVKKPNRLLIGACIPYVHSRRLGELGEQVGLHPSLIDVIDIGTASFSAAEHEKEEKTAQIVSAIKTGVTRLKRLDPTPVETVRINQQALVLGGGIAGMTAALAIADHGFKVSIVEQSEQLGGNLLWLKQTIEGHETRTIFEETLHLVKKHSLIQVYTGSNLVNSMGEVGLFHTTIEDSEGIVHSIEHGVTIIATGGKESPTTSYGYGTNQAIVTQKELETGLNDSSIDPTRLKSLVMIQCVDSREEPRNYCSRVCCLSSLKHALRIKGINPGIKIYILYRDMMTYGFAEAYYTRARKSDIFFINYNTDNKPEINPMDGIVRVTVFEPILGQKIHIDADLVVLATGIIPNFPKDLTESYGIDLDRDGFFQEAESKWRPVDSLKEGIFACGLAHSPRSIAESVSTAEAAAQRALRILTKKELPAGKVVAKVHHSLCSVCEQCIEACPYGARSLDMEGDRVLVNPVMCQGCGSCAAVCPNSASVLEGFHIQQMLEIIDAAFV